MSEERRARIITKPTGEGQVEIVTQDPQTGRTVGTGHVVSKDRADGEIRKVKETLEKGGNRVTVKEL